MFDCFSYFTAATHCDTVKPSTAKSRLAWLKTAAIQTFLLSAWVRKSTILLDITLTSGNSERHLVWRNLLLIGQLPVGFGNSACQLGVVQVGWYFKYCVVWL